MPIVFNSVVHDAMLLVSSLNHGSVLYTPQAQTLHINDVVAHLRTDANMLNLVSNLPPTVNIRDRDNNITKSRRLCAPSNETHNALILLCMARLGVICFRDHR